MPSWFADHLPCAPPTSWLPEVLAGKRVALASRTRVPSSLVSVLASSVELGPDVRCDAVVHLGALHLAPAVTPELFERSGASVWIDLATVAPLSGWWRLRPWRLGVVRRDVAGRVVWASGLGLSSPQQWVCARPLPMVVTLARRRFDAK